MAFIIESNELKKYIEEDGVTDVIIPGNVTSIDNYAFCDCHTLTSIVVPDSVVTSGFGIFKNCENLVSVTLGSGFEEIKFAAFKGCKSLNKIFISPENKTYTDIDGIVYDKSLTVLLICPQGRKSADIRDGIIAVGDSAFEKCVFLTSVIIPDSVKYIEQFAFSECLNLSSVTLGKNITCIDRNAFAGCTSLTEIEIPDSVDTIAYDTFLNCTSLRKVNIPEIVKTIEASTFKGCSSLTSITLPDSITSIEENAFMDCASLTSFTMPESVETINRAIFKNCKNLVSVQLNSKIKYVPANFFEGCEKLISVQIPENVASIEESAFKNCTSLTEITFPANVKKICYNAFKNCTNLKTVNITNGMEKIDGMAFEGCTALTAITIPDSVTYVVDDAFKNCTSLTEITVPVAVDYAGYTAFGGCTELKTVNFVKSSPNKTALFWKMAFDGCKSITSVNIPEGVTSISFNTFSNCTGLTSVTLPESLTSVEERAFEGCTGLTSITIPENVTFTGNGAFGDCTNLSEVTICGNKIEFASENKGGSVFVRCTSLKRVIFKNGIPEIPKKTFAGCTSLPEILLCNAPIKDWNDRDCMKKPQAAAGFMNAFIDGMTFDEEIIEANKKWIKAQKRKLLDTAAKYKNCVVYMIREKLLSFEDAEYIKQVADDNSEISKLLDDYTDNMPKKPEKKSGEAIYLTNFTLAEYKKAFGLKDDGNGGYIIGSYMLGGSNITIPAEIKGKPVTAVEAFAFSPDREKLTPGQRELRRKIKSIVLPESVNTIGEYAFKGCTGLVSVEAGKNVMTVGKGAFLNCLNVQENELAKKFPESLSGDKLAGMSITVTGELSGYTRDEFKDLVKQNGGKLTGSTSAYTSFIVTNRPGSMTEKLQAAAENGVPVISECDFCKLIK